LQKSVLDRLGEYAFRLCTTSDIPRVVEINSLTLPEHYSDYFYYEILSEFPQTFLVAELGDEVVAYIMCRTEYGLSLIKRFGLARKGHVISIATIEKHRGKGIGTKLISLAMNALKASNSKECYLEVRVTNEEAIVLYKKLGFDVMSTLQGYYKDGESAYLMAIPL
jgi:[ribosomal protein S18]-alanine N-acetyltransferase